VAGQVRCASSSLLSEVIWAILDIVTDCQLAMCCSNSCGRSWKTCSCECCSCCSPCCRHSRTAAAA
jgi:hypothetical protein